MATQQATQARNSPHVAGKDQPKEDIQPLDDALDYLRTYARQKPETTALVCIGIGFVLGWKLKPW